MSTLFYSFPVCCPVLFHVPSIGGSPIEIGIHPFIKMHHHSFARMDGVCKG